MSIGPIVNLASGYIQSLFSNSSSGNAASTTAAATTTAAAQDSNQLSPFAKLLSTLQELQQSNPTQYQQVTKQISGNLQTAASSATASGNTTLASELTQLSSDFQTASTSGQLPSVSDLAQAIGGGKGSHHHHHHGGGSSAEANSTVNQFLQALDSSQNTSSATNTLNPLSIISNTLTSAGVSLS